MLKCPKCNNEVDSFWFSYKIFSKSTICPNCKSKLERTGNVYLYRIIPIILVLLISLFIHSELYWLIFTMIWLVFIIISPYLPKQIKVI